MIVKITKLKNLEINTTFYCIGKTIILPILNIKISFIQNHIKMSEYINQFCCIFIFCIICLIFITWFIQILIDILMYDNNFEKTNSVSVSLQDHTSKSLKKIN